MLFFFFGGGHGENDCPVGAEAGNRESFDLNTRASHIRPHEVDCRGSEKSGNVENMHTMLQFFTVGEEGRVRHRTNCTCVCDVRNMRCMRVVGEGGHTRCFCCRRWCSV